MIRIHRLYSTFLPSDRDRMEQVKTIFRQSFPGVADYADKIADQLEHPFAAQFLSSRGRVAVLDIDYHHGNGTQDIFYRRGDVLTVSLHGHPNIAYPYFSGFADETGEEGGKGFNLNLPLAEHTDGDGYLKALDRALAALRRYKPSCLIVSLGFDTLKGDPTGSFTLSTRTMTEIGRNIAKLGLPMLFVQEGGYNLRNLRSGVVRLFDGVAQGVASSHP